MSCVAAQRIKIARDQRRMKHVGWSAVVKNICRAVRTCSYKAWLTDTKTYWPSFGGTFGTIIII